MIAGWRPGQRRNRPRPERRCRAGDRGDRTAHAPQRVRADRSPDRRPGLGAGSPPPIESAAPPAPPPPLVSAGGDAPASARTRRRPDQAPRRRSKVAHLGEGLRRVAHDSVPLLRTTGGSKTDAEDAHSEEAVAELSPYRVGRLDGREHHTENLLEPTAGTAGVLGPVEQTAIDIQREARGGVRGYPLNAVGAR